MSVSIPLPTLPMSKSSGVEVTFSVTFRLIASLCPMKAMSLTLGSPLGDHLAVSLQFPSPLNVQLLLDAHADRAKTVKPAKATTTRLCRRFIISLPQIGPGQHTPPPERVGENY